MTDHGVHAYETVDVAYEEGGVAVVTLNRPDKRNAMNPTMTEEMAHVLEALRYDPAARVIVLTGAGQSFCAGMDLKEFFVALKDRPDEYDRIERISYEWRSRTLRYYPKPTIAMVNGHVFGGGLTIVEACDLAIAATDAPFGVSEINFRMLPAGPVSRSLGQMLRPRDALFYALTGRPFDGAQAERIGLVNMAVPQPELRETTLALAREIATKDAHALQSTKDAYRLSQEMSADAAMNYANAKYHELTLLQQGAWRQTEVQGFLDKEFKPGLGTRDAQARG